MEKFDNTLSGETFVHLDRANGKSDLKFGKTGSSLPNHAVFMPNGNLSYLRENGHVIADDLL